MASSTKTSTTITARGKVTGKNGTVVKFVPHNTTYELHLVAPDFEGPMNTLVDGVIRATARKAYTVPSGGNFVSPIYGPPRTIQGRVHALDGNAIVIHAGAPIHVELPPEASGVELRRGPITVGSLVNVVALPGATFELNGTRPTSPTSFP
jgi:hypothetical protein